MSARPELDPARDPVLVEMRDPAFVEAIQQRTAQLKLYRQTAECRELTAQLDERDRIVTMIASQRATPLTWVRGNGGTNTKTTPASAHPFCKPALIANADKLLSARKLEMSACNFSTLKGGTLAFSA